MRGWGRFDLRPEQGQPFPSFVRREQLSAHLQPQDMGRLVQPEVWDKQVGLDPNERLCQMVSGSCRIHLSPTDASTTRATISQPCPVAPASGFFWRAPLQGARPRRATRARRFAGGIRPGARRPAVVDQPDGLDPRSKRAEESPDAPLPRNVRAPPQVANRERRHRQRSMLSSAAMTA